MSQATETRDSHGAILIEEHRRRMRRIRNRFVLVTVLLIALSIALPAYLYFDRQVVISGWKIVEKKTENLNLELDHFRTKEKLLSTLRTKPLTVSQALDVCEVILTQNKVPATIVLGILEQESQFKADAISYKGARGIAQMMPATFTAYTPKPLVQIMDPATNVRASINYLADMYEQYKDWKVVLRIYQAGPQHAKNKAFDWYANAVLARVERYEKEMTSGGENDHS